MRKIYSIFLALVMMFAFASTAMAAEAPTLTVVANGDVLANAVTVEVGDSVYDAVDSWAKANGYAIDWTDVTSELGGTGMVLKSLDGKGSVPYNSPDLDEYEIYDPEDVNDPYLAKANKVLEDTYPTSGGLYLWLGNGVGMNYTGAYGIYVGQDWMFTVNGERPAVGTIEKYMNETTVNAGDEIVLTYGMVYEPYEIK